MNFLCGLMAISHCQPLSSPAAAVLVRHRCCHPPLSFNVHCHRPSVCQKPHLCILPVTSADFLCKIYPQFTHCNMRISTHLHFTAGRISKDIIYCACTQRTTYYDYHVLSIMNIFCYTFHAFHTELHLCTGQSQCSTS